MYDETMVRTTATQKERLLSEVESHIKTVILPQIEPHMEYSTKLVAKKNKVEIYTRAATLRGVSSTNIKLLVLYDLLQLLRYINNEQHQGHHTWFSLAMTGKDNTFNDMLLYYELPSYAPPSVVKLFDDIRFTERKSTTMIHDPISNLKIKVPQLRKAITDTINSIASLAKEELKNTAADETSRKSTFKTR